jgi:hypothetical protein
VSDRETEISLQDIFGSTTEEKELKLEALRDFYSSDNLDLKTDLNNEHIEAIVQIDLIQKYVKDEWDIDLKLNDATDLFKRLRVSHNRKGRTEFVEALKTFVMDTLGDKSTIRKVMGL